MKYRYTLEKYRGIRSRYTCPQCGRKYVFTRYIDTETNQYISDDVGKCSRLDKCGYHYTPKQYFSDNAWKNECHFVKMTREMTNKHLTPKPSFLPEQSSALNNARGCCYSLLFLLLSVISVIKNHYLCRKLDDYGKSCGWIIGRS